MVNEALGTQNENSSGIFFLCLLGARSLLQKIRVRRLIRGGRAGCGGVGDRRLALALAGRLTIQ